jgi:hypothetical protein
VTDPEAAYAESEVQHARRIAVEHETASPSARVAATAAREVALLGGVWIVYELGRHLARNRRGTAIDDARLIHHAEAIVHLPPEATLQGAVGSAALLRIADVYYVSVHFALAAVFLAWAFARRPRTEYRWARTLMICQTLGALVLHLAFPLAPPRMFPQWGFVDTMTTYGPSAYAGGSGGFADQYAAMPSLHVGWDLLMGIALVTYSSHLAVRVLGVVLPTLMAISVVLTANHYVIDAVAGIALVLACLWVVRSRTLRRVARPVLPAQRRGDDERDPSTTADGCLR